MHDPKFLQRAPTHHPPPLFRRLGGRARRPGARLAAERRRQQRRPARRACRAGALHGLHFPPRIKRIIYLFQSGGPSQHDLFDYKPLLEREERRATCPTSSARASGSPACRPSRRRFRSPGRIFKFAQHGKPARGSASCCRIIARSSTTCASSSRCTPRRSTTTRRSRSFRPARRSPAGRRWARGSSYGLGR